MFGTPLESRQKAAVSLLLQFFLVFATSLCIPASQLSAQNLPPPNSTIAEEQDYAFAFGLYRDGLFENAADQFSLFTRKYPRSIRYQDAQFLHADCLLQLERFAEAAREFSSFVREHSSTPLADNARFKLGDVYLKLKRNIDAIETYKSILDRPMNPAVAGEAAYWIGETYLKDADYANALKYYALSYEGFPGNRLQDYAAYSAAWTNQRKGDLVKAAEWYTIVVDKFPQSQLVPSARLKIGECLYALKDYTKTIAELTAARSLIDSVALKGEADYLIAESFYNLADYEKSLTHYEQFMRDYPDHRLIHEVQYALAWSYFKGRRFAEAAEAFGKLPAADSVFGLAALYRKGVAEKLAGSRTAAMDSFESVVDQDPRAEYADNALYDIGLMLFEDKKADAAKRYFARVLNDYPASDVLADASMMLGECQVATSSFDSAAISFERSLKNTAASFETRVTATYQLAWSNYKSRNFKEAAKGFAAFMKSFPGHPKTPDAQYWLAESEYQAGDYRNALRHFQEIVKNTSHAHREESMYGIGWAYYKLREYPRAIESFERLVVAYPSGKLSFDGRLRLGDCYFQQKDYKKAAGSYRTVIRLFPSHDGADYALYQLGQTYYRSGDHEQASDQFSLLLKSYPASALADDAQYALGWMKFQRKDYLGAVKEFQATLTNYPASELLPRVSYSIGDAYYNLKQYGAAEKAYREVIQRYPRSPYAADALTGVQYSLVAQGKSKEAVGAIDSYVKENPTSADAEKLELKKADLYFSQKEYADAAKTYRAFAAQYPNSPLRAQALFGLAKSLQESDSLREAADTYAMTAEEPVVTSTIRGNAVLESVRLYRKLGDYEQAYMILSRGEKSLAETEFAPELSYTKGLVFEDNGAFDNAKAAYEFVVSKYPATTEADRSRNGLARIALAMQQFSVAKEITERVATTRTDEVGAEAQYLSALALEKGGDWRNAITSYLKLKYVFPSHERWLVKAYLGLGRCYEEIQDVLKARESYLQVVTLDKSGEDFEEATRRLSVIGRE